MQVIAKRMLNNSMRFYFAASGDQSTAVQVSYNHLSSHRWLNYDESHKVFPPQQWKKSLKTHKSRSEEYIHRVPVVEVEEEIVRCIGGTQINAGHPQVYIMLNTRTPGKAQTCKYCGVKYRLRSHDHHDHHDSHDS